MAEKKADKGKGPESSGLDGGDSGLVNEESTGQGLEDEPDALGKGLKKILKPFKGCLGQGAKEDVSSEPYPHQHCPAIPPDQDSDEYDFTHARRGRAIVINNELFHNNVLAAREGSSEDVKLLRAVFERLGFESQDVVCHENLTTEQMKETLKQEAARPDHPSSDCLIVAVLSHGYFQKRMPGHTFYDRTYNKHKDRVYQDLVFGAGGETVSTQSLMEIFQDCRSPGLAGKPKIFLFQACRGDDYDDGVDIAVITEDEIPSSTAAKDEPPLTTDSKTDTPSATNAKNDTPLATDAKNDTPLATDAKNDSPLATAVKNDTPLATDAKHNTPEKDESDAKGQRSRFYVSDFVVSPVPLFKDFLVVYSTPPGYSSFRRGSGSWLMQSLHHVVTTQLSPAMSLSHLLTRTAATVAFHFQSSGDNPDKKQVPVVQSMLTKNVYFVEKPSPLS